MSKFEDHLEICYDKIDKIIESLSSVHSANMQKLSDSYSKSIEKLSKYKYRISDIIMSSKRQAHNKIYPRLEDLKYAGKNMLELEKKLFDFNAPQFSEISENLYDFPDFLVFDLWKKAKIHECDHAKNDLFLTSCGKAHCKVCLEESINKLAFTCPCGVTISPKSVFQVSGERDDLSTILKQVLEQFKSSKSN